MAISRRRFLQTAGAAGALVASGAWHRAGRARATTLPGPLGGLLPQPDSTGIEHVVVVMMENRSFDHFLGWLPGADGIQAGLTFLDQNGIAHHTHPLAPEWNGCAHPDPDHSYEGGRVQFDGGLNDGWLFKGSGDDEFALGYYVEADRPFMSSLARHYTALDRYFCSILAETYPNRFFMHSATTDRLHNNGVTQTTIPLTIWDRLKARGVSHRYYFNDLPFLALWGTKYIDTCAPYAQFLLEAASGQLPAVSFVDPRFLGEGALVDVGPNDAGGGISNDDHPHADIRAGDHLLAEIFHALTLSPNWANTVLIINYDEWGGFYDHVPPPRAAASAPLDKDVVNGQARLGFRVPCIVASPFTKGDPTSPRVYGSPQGQTVPFDHTSVLKLIEWRFGLAPLTARDASSDVGNLLDVFDFAHPQTSVPSDIPFPLPPILDPCGPTNPGPVSALGVRDNSWAALAGSKLLKGWNLPKP